MVLRLLILVLAVDHNVEAVDHDVEAVDHGVEAVAVVAGGTGGVEAVDEDIDAVQWWLLASFDLRGLGPLPLEEQGKTLPLCKQVTAMTAAILKDNRLIEEHCRGIK